MKIEDIKNKGSRQYGLQCIYMEPFYFKCCMFYSDYPTDAFMKGFLDEEGEDLYDEENLMHPVIALQSFEQEFTEFLNDVHLLKLYLISVCELITY